MIDVALILFATCKRYTILTYQMEYFDPYFVSRFSIFQIKNFCVQKLICLYLSSLQVSRWKIKTWRLGNEILMTLTISVSGNFKNSLNRVERKSLKVKHGRKKVVRNTTYVLNYFKLATLNHFVQY